MQIESPEVLPEDEVRAETEWENDVAIRKTTIVLKSLLFMGQGFKGCENNAFIKLNILRFWGLHNFLTAPR
jgi:hypothetical protein